VISFNELELHDMGLLDGILGGAGGGGFGQNMIVDAIAAKLGIPAGIAEAAVGALMNNHAQPGNTVTNAAQQSGVSSDILGKIMGQMGGAGGLGAIVGALNGGGGHVQDPDQPDAQAPEGGLESILAGLTGGGGGAGGLLSGIAGSLLGGKN
jgi:hypothetical protein